MYSAFDRFFSLLSFENIYFYKTLSLFFIYVMNRSFKIDLLRCSRCSTIFDYIHLQLSPNFESEFVLLNLTR